MVDEIKKKCETEILWAQKHIDSMKDDPGFFKFLMSCWLDMHKEILELIEILKGRM